jgi:hypothetical protein
MTPLDRAKAALAVEFRATFDGPSLVAVPAEDLRALIEFAELAHAWGEQPCHCEECLWPQKLADADSALFG